METTKKILFTGFMAMIGLVMASTTFLFGYNHLTIAGTDMVGRLVGGMYALLLADIAFWLWFGSWLREGLTPTQRSMAIILTVVGFILSLFFTLGHLTLTTELGQYINPNTVKQFVFWTVILSTSLNALGMWIYSAKSAGSEIRATMAESNSNILQTALAQAKNLLAEDTDHVAMILSNQIRDNMLAQIGFTPQLTQIGTNTKGKKKKPTQPENEPIEGQLVTPTPLKPSKKFGLWRNGYIISESDNIDDLRNNPAYFSESHIVDQNGVIVKDPEFVAATAVITPTPQNDSTVKDFNLDNDDQRYVIILANGKRPYLSQSDYRTAEALARSAVDMTGAAVTIHDQETGKDVVIDPKG